ncbi:MAG: ABC transporter ATP-binding protein [Opitutales bacterium]|nr:ABC transporter ATP-binding protein [Opitutales bacterium]
MNDYRDIAVSIEGISKRYRILKSLQKQSDRSVFGIAHAVTLPIRRMSEIFGLTHFGSSEDEDSIFWALKNVNLEIKKGEVFGIIGHNGAGKSTLLKILSRITAPTEGRIEIHGRVSSLLEVGTGFHPELTGRENIYMNGTLHGMSKREIDQKLDDIVDFSGVSKYIDMPIKRYSSGMGVRLGFAVAAFLEPQILIVDEVLAVGDADFRRKCGNKMTEVSRDGKTVILVSHNMGIIENMCSNAVVLKSGKIDHTGSAAECVKHYLFESADESYLNDTGIQDLTEHVGRKSKFDQLMKLTYAKVLNVDKQPTFFHKSGDPIEFEIGYRFAKEVRDENCEFGIAIKNDLGVIVSYFSNYMVNMDVDTAEKEGVVRCVVRGLFLETGDYWVNLRCRCASIWSDSLINAFRISISAKKSDVIERIPLSPESGLIVADQSWS